MGRKLSVGDTLGEAFSIYRAQAGVLLPVAFWLFLVVAIVDGLIGQDVALLPILAVVSTVAGTLYEGMVVGLVRDVQDGRRDSSMGELVRAALPVLLPLIGAGLLSGLAIGVGFVLLVVPGLYLMTIWAVIAPAIVVERTGVLAAFSRSRELVRGNGWPVCGAVVVALLISVSGALVLGSIAEGIADGPLIRIVFSAIGSTVTAPVLALVVAVVYYRLQAIETPPVPLAGDSATT
ncbi:MAG: hypothetical protein WD810_03625 [Solirubrobacterales bacterium]